MSIRIAALAAAGMLLALAPGDASAQRHWHGGGPRVGFGITLGGPGYYGHGPRYYAPRPYWGPAYVAPPAYFAPPPVYVAPPVYAAPPAYYPPAYVPLNPAARGGADGGYKR